MPSLTMMPVETSGMNQGSTEKVLKCLIPPGVTRENNRTAPGTTRTAPDSIGAHTDPGRATETHRRSPAVPQ
ncbi:hypothetical protein DPMN_098760 [Dreissena polymorpha]|uniref:Uncharacterized protein n=1 Tax=Dreissena polymorpha TaxID=45954 RepID=A0A9D4LCQ6_DREPO|nr:hypothetical protein DPMN_098760 [Dreissena polymorpha]